MSSRSRVAERLRSTSWTSPTTPPADSRTGWHAVVEAAADLRSALHGDQLGAGVLDRRARTSAGHPPLRPTLDDPDRANPRPSH